MANIRSEQKSILAYFNRIETNYKKDSKSRKGQTYFKTKLENLTERWSTFKENHKRLIEGEQSDELKEYWENFLYDDTEEAYVSAKSFLQEEYDKAYPEKVSESNMSVTELQSYSVAEQPQLPKINIPKFSGQYSGWVSFNDMFQTLIHTNNKLSDVQKLQYLKSSVQGEAESLIKHLSVVGSNYQIAWQFLESRFDNKRVLIKTELNKLLHQQRISVESATNIKKLLDTTNESLAALKNLNVKVQEWGILVTHIISEMLPNESKKLWEHKIGGDKEFPSFERLTKFLEARFRTLEALGETHKASNQNPRFNNNNLNQNHSKRTFLVTNTYSCVLCSGPHSIRKCDKFLKLKFEEKRNIVFQKRLCSNCLSKGHVSKSCPSRTSCFHCKKRHHSLLHNASLETSSQGAKNSASTSTSNNVPTVPSTSTDTTHTFHLQKGLNRSTILLATALAKIRSHNGRELEVRLLIDPCSEMSFVTEKVVQQLQLKTLTAHTKILALAESEAVMVKRMSSFSLTSLDGKSEISVEAAVINKLTGFIPSSQVHPKTSWSFLEGLTLADPSYLNPAKVDILLGADKYRSIMLSGVKFGAENEPIAQQTIFGWIVTGKVNNVESPALRNQSVCFCTTSMLNESLKKFWELEEISNPEYQLTDDEKYCEEYFQKTTQRTEKGKYIVRIPFKNAGERPKLGKSRFTALNRLKSLEHRFMNSTDFQKQYSEVVQEYLDLGHMVPTLVPENDNCWYNSDGQEFYKSNYLPHHAVFKESITTSLRVVFDASSKTQNGVSLNDSMLAGPKLQDDLLSILMRWRKHEFVFTADVEKMYRQIYVHTDDADFQRILWRSSLEEPVKDYVLKTVTFGTTSAPYLAIRVLQRLADDESKNYPEASKIAKSDFYVDDLLTGAETIKEVLQIRSQLANLLQSGGFNLRKWTANNETLLAEIPERDKEKSGILKFDINENVKTLGLNWYPKGDFFKYKLGCKFQEETSITKRKLLSNISKIFDPLGFLAPLTVKLKVLMQCVWLRGVGWDEMVPEDISNVWFKIVKEIEDIENVQIPRWLGTKKGHIEIHGFSDGSLHAFSAVLYIRNKAENGNVSLHLLTGKTKVTPVKVISMPRIELCGAVLLARLFNTMKNAMHFENITFVAWTDSTTVFTWIQDFSKKYGTFVGNRIAEIQKLTDAQCWNFVPGIMNPADCATRGVDPAQLQHLKLWWDGPEWLKGSMDSWPRLPEGVVNQNEVNSELRKSANTLTTQRQSSFTDELLIRYSHLEELVRITSYIFRFKNIMLKIKRYGNLPLTVREQESTLQFWINKIQQDAFPEEFKEGTERKSDQLKSLNPFLDVTKILRVGGRLTNSELPWTQKHPIILPSSSFFTELVIRNAHKATMHGGIQLVLNVLRERYWVLNARSTIRHHIHKCRDCYRQKVETRQQLMGELPAVRVTRARPFEHTGVDFCGPFDLKSSRLRNAKIIKVYIALFVCLATKAIHIEVVSDLTTQAFLAALKRFVSRRGLCRSMASDNATNFVGARNTLDKDFQLHIKQLKEAFPEIMSREKIEWHFIPPSSPHHGGIWEAGVKSTKHHLKRILGNTKLTYEEFTTISTQIEACLNSRPLCKISDDPEDLSALTPGHFLIGTSLLSVPEPSYLDQKIHHLNRWQYMQQLIQGFWVRWHKEYLHTLQQRPKWLKRTENLQIGNIVIVKDDNLPPCKWMLAKIVEIHPGKDGLVRVVSIKTQFGILKRCINKLCLLPIIDNDNSQEEQRKD